MCQIDFSVMQSPHVLPILVTLRKILPRPIPAALSHSSNCSFTQSGIGTVRTCPALPSKSTIAQCSSRCLGRQSAGKRLHAVSAQTPVATQEVLGPAFLLAPGYLALAKESRPAPLSTSFQGEHPVSSHL